MSPASPSRSRFWGRARLELAGRVTVLTLFLARDQPHQVALSFPDAWAAASERGRPASPHRDAGDTREPERVVCIFWTGDNSRMPELPELSARRRASARGRAVGQNRSPPSRRPGYRHRSGFCFIDLAHSAGTGTAVLPRATETRARARLCSLDACPHCTHDKSTFRAVADNDDALAGLARRPR